MEFCRELIATIKWQWILENVLSYVTRSWSDYVLAMQILRKGVKLINGYHDDKLLLVEGNPESWWGSGD